MMRNEPMMTPNQTPDMVDDEAVMLMSMALDGLLDADEQARLDQMLADDPHLAAEWQEWQMLDSQLTSVPYIAPPPTFWETFDLRLAQQQRRRQLWWGLGFGAIVVLLAAGILLGTVAFGAFVLISRPDWMSVLIHNVAFASAAVGQWLQVLQNAFWSVAGAEQTRTFGLIYAVTAAALLAAWILFLRRTTRTMGSAQHA